MLPFAPANPLPPRVYTSCEMTALLDHRPSVFAWRTIAENTHETKNNDTPIPPKSENTPAAGKMIIPSTFSRKYIQQLTSFLSLCGANKMKLT
jgi:hypothetical protein